MVMGVSVESSELWEGVLELTKTAQDNNSDALLWAVQLSASLSAAGVGLPSVELAHLLVSHICFGNHVPITWKFLDKALAVKIAPPMLVLSLLSIRSSFNKLFLLLIFFFLLILKNVFIGFHMLELYGQVKLLGIFHSEFF
jgi:hypothetical protein